MCGFRRNGNCKTARRTINVHHRAASMDFILKQHLVNRFILKHLFSGAPFTAARDSYIIKTSTDCACRLPIYLSAIHGAELL